MFFYYNVKSQEFIESTAEKDTDKDPTLIELGEKKYNLWKAFSLLDYESGQEFLDEWYKDISYQPRCAFCRSIAVYNGWEKPNGGVIRRLNVCEEHVGKLRGEVKDD